MEQSKLKAAMASALKNTLGVDALTLPAERRPSGWLAGKDLDAYVAQVRAEFQAGVWTGGLLPHSYPAPADAVPGAAYWIITPGGSVIFQYGSSPYVPDTPGLAPGTLTPDNVEVALQAHLQAMVEEEARNRLVMEYVNWVAEAML